MSILLRPDFPAKPQPPRKRLARIPVSGATPADIEQVANEVDLVFHMAVSALMGRLENLRENLPVGEVEFSDIYEILRDCRSDVLGRLEKAADRGL